MALFPPLHRLIRYWEDATQNPMALREPQVPARETPDAFIEWGGASSFDADDFRSVANNPGFRVAPRSRTPLHGTFKEEGRKWEDFELTDPDDSSVKIMCRRTTELALKADYRTKPEGEKLSQGIKNDQLRVSFSNGGAEQDPTYTSIGGNPVAPIVLSPLEQIVAVNWGGPFVLMSGVFGVRPGGGQLAGVRLVLETPFPMPDLDGSLGASEMKRQGFGILVQSNNDDLSWVVFFVNPSALAKAFDYTAIPIRIGFYLGTTISQDPDISGDIAGLPLLGTMRSVVYTKSSYAALDEFMNVLQTADLGSDLNSALNQLMIPGGFVMRQTTLTGPPLIADAEVAVPAVPNPPPPDNDPTRNQVDWFWDYTHRHFTPFSPPQWAAV